MRRHQQPGSSEKRRKVDRRREVIGRACLFEPLEVRRLLAAELIKDINPSSTDYGTPAALTDVNGTLYFNSQYKLWKSDGTAAGTLQVTNNVWDPQQLINLNGTLLFNSQGTLYKSNGTEAGTVPVGAATAMNPRDMIASGGKVFFRGADAGGDELWVTDGTPAGTLRLKDVRPGGESSDIRGMIDVNGRLFFRADDGTSGQELWTSDGTAAGTVRVKDILPGAQPSGPSSFVNVNGTLYFTAYDGTHGYELWKSDGTDAGTTMVLDIRTGAGGSTPTMLQKVGGKVMFLANDATHGFELWQSDGTAAGTTLIRDIIRGSAGAQIDNLRSVGSNLFFTADDGVNGHELWKTDGTAAGTVLLKNIAGGSFSSYPGALNVIGGKLYFTANNAVTGQELWTSDGTEAGTTLLKDVWSGPAFSQPRLLTASGANVFFVAHDGTSPALFKSDGTSAGTSLVARSVVHSNGSSSMNNALRIGSTVYFAANDGVNGQELWKTDGTSGATSMVKDLNPGAGGTGISEMTNFNGTLFFIGNGKIWKSDGTGAGTVTVGSSVVNQPLNLTAVGNTLFFRGWSPAGYELWKTDGTDAGTMMVKDVNSTGVHSSPESLVNHNGTLMFVANDGVHGFELWKSDGTAAGTVMVSDIIAGEQSSGPYLLTSVGSNVYFRANDGTHGYELWKTDGTAAGTVMVRDVRAGSANSVITSLINVGGRLFFSADDGVHGQELWTTDGTPAGTVMMNDIYSGKRGSSPGALTDVGGVLYFRADNGVNGQELWKSDGTVAGTVMVKDVNTGAAASTPVRIVNVNGIAAFAAADAHGYRLWRSDGSVNGTYPIHTTLAFDPVALGDELLFHAWDNWADEPLKINVRTSAALASSPSSAPAPITPTPATFEFDGTFRFIDIAVRTNKPSLVPFGMMEFYGAYNDPYATTYDLSIADETQVRRLAERHASTNTPVMFDIEHWQTDLRGYSEGMVAHSVERMAQIADWMHDERPDVTLGYAAFMVGNNPFPAEGSPQRIAWQNAIARAEPVADRSDYILPNINPFIADVRAWPDFADAMIDEARKFGKPVVAFLWPNYDGTEPNLYGRAQTAEFFRMQLDVARSRADSLAIWDDTRPWVEDMSWWIVTQDFIQNQDSLPPATATNVSSAVVEGNKIRVTWTDNAYNEAAYRIERRAWNEQGFTTVANLGANATSFTDAGVAPSSNYTYRVVAIGEASDSMSSEEVVGRVVLAPSTPGNVSASPLSSRRVRISWTEASQDVSGFVIERSINGGAFVELISVGSSARSHDDTGLTPGVTYAYRVRAFNAVGSSPNSTDVSATTPLNDLAIRANWRFDNSSADSSANGHHAALFGSPVWTSGTLGSALSFDGIDDRATVSDASDLRFSASDDFSLSAWVNLASLPGRRMSVLSKGLIGGARYGIGIDASNRWMFSSASSEIVGSTATTGWTHLAAVQDGVNGTRKLYVNGVLVASGAAQAADGSGALWIGASESAGEFFAGKVDDVRVYGKALSASHVAALASPIVSLNATAAGTQWTMRVDSTGSLAEFSSPTEATFARPIDAVAGVNFIGAGGNDTLVIDNADGDVLPMYQISFAGGAGSDALDFRGLAPADPLNLDATHLWQGDRSTSFSSVERLKLSNGTYAVAGDLGPVDLTVNASATVGLATGQHLSSLTIVDGAVNLAAGGSATLVVGQVLVTGTGQLDLADNDLIVNYSDASPIGTWTGVGYAGVRAMVAAGRIRTSSANALTYLGVAEASEVLGLQPGQTAPWSGQTADATSVLVKYTYTGDANLDGRIDIDDYGVIDFYVNLGMTGVGQSNGDFNRDGIIDIDDYGLIDFVVNIQGLPL